MNREELIEKLGLLYDEPWNDVEEYFELVADLVEANFQPKQSETVTAKEFFLVYETDLYGDKLFRAAFSSREKAISYIKESDQRRHFDIDTHDLNPESHE